MDIYLCKMGGDLVVKTQDSQTHAKARHAHTDRSATSAVGSSRRRQVYPWGLQCKWNCWRRDVGASCAPKIVSISHAPVPLTARTEPFIFPLEAGDWNHGPCATSVWCVGRKWTVKEATKIERFPHIISQFVMMGTPHCLSLAKTLSAHRAFRSSLQTGLR